jgi:hypothetical protein
MKITIKEMWESLDRIVFPWYPANITCKECGYTIPEALKQAAVCMVRDPRENYYSERNPNQRMLDEQNVVDGLREIRQYGFIQFTDAKGIM